MPLWPLIATLAAQTLATMALFSLPAIAPAVAEALGVRGELVGVFVSVAYGSGIVSALLSPGFIHRYGGVRAIQAVLVAAAAMLIIAARGSIGSLAVAAVVLGLGYGAAAPASTHLRVPHTPARVFNMVMSLRQIGVPLGGVLGSLLLPPLLVVASGARRCLPNFRRSFCWRRSWSFRARNGTRRASRCDDWSGAPCCGRSRCSARRRSAACPSPASCIPGRSSHSLRS